MAPSWIPAAKNPPSLNMLDYTSIDLIQKYSDGSSDSHVICADDMEYQPQGGDTNMMVRNIIFGNDEC